MKQKSQKIAGSALPVLLLTLLLFVVQAASRPSTGSTENEGDLASLPPDADNVEFHHVRVVDGVMHEDHPVVMYKEDFVTEDYDPSKNETKTFHPKLFRGQQRIRHHRLKSAAKQLRIEEPTEKIVFDVLPETPLVMNDDDSAADNFEVAQDVQPSKEDLLQKYPKKYHSRHRRHADNPYSRRYSVQQPAVFYNIPAQPKPYYQRYPVRGNSPKYSGKLRWWQTKRPITTPAVSIDNRDGFQDSSLFHNSNPDDADFSVFDQARPEETPTLITGGGGFGGGASGGSSWNNWQSPPEEDRVPWSASDSHRQGLDVAYRPESQAPQPSQSQPPAQMRPRQDAVLYPTDPVHDSGSACHRASKLCCSLADLGSLYDCFNRQYCEYSIAEIISSCS